MKTNANAFPRKIFSVDVAGFFQLSDEDNYSGIDLLNAEDVGYLRAKENCDRIVKRYNAYDDLVKTLTILEDIISGIEAQADNKGLDLSEARHWWSDARKLLDKLEDHK